VRWQPGEEVVWRETWRGRTYSALPVRVVKDDEREIAVYLAEGTEFSFSPDGWPFEGQHPYAGRGGWEGHGVLVLHRYGTAHAVWHFWSGPERRFVGWYVNLQAPFVRDGTAFDTNDHELDIWVEPDGSWRWKDEEKMEDWVRQGRFTPDDVAAIRREGERVLAEWPFPTGWEEWSPDPSWAVPRLPTDWEPSSR
jgi:hypothetical protein